MVDFPITFFGRDELDPSQHGGAREQRVERDLDAGEDRAAEVLALRAHRVDGVGGAEVDDDRRAAVEVVRADRVGDAVGADVVRLVVEDRHAGAHAGLEHQRLVPEVPLGHLAERGGDARHARRDHHARHVRVEREAVEAEELLEHQRQLVGRPLGHGGDAPVVDELAVGEQADDGLGVAAVDGEQHGYASSSAGTSGRMIEREVERRRRLRDRRWWR